MIPIPPACQLDEPLVWTIHGVAPLVTSSININSTTELAKALALMAVLGQ